MVLAHGLMRFQSRSSWCCCHLKAGLGQEELFPTWFTHMTHTLVLAFCQEAIVAYHMDLFLGLLASSRAVDPGKQGRSHSVFYDLPWKSHVVTVQCFISYTALFIVGGYHTKICLLGSKDHWEPSCRLATTVHPSRST